MSSKRERLVEVAYAHARAENVEGDLEATLATLEDDCVYELHPAGLLIPGIALARRYYQYYLSDFAPLIAGYTMRQEWVTDDGLGQEYTLWTRAAGGTLERHEIIGILTFGTTRLSGERLYTSNRLLRLMFGPILDEAQPVAVGGPAD
jgi:hypothetical protein